MRSDYLSSLKPWSIFEWEYRKLSGTVSGRTRAEAREELKRQLGFQRLPPGMVIRLRPSARTKPPTP